MRTRPSRYDRSPCATAASLECTHIQPEGGAMLLGRHFVSQWMPDAIRKINQTFMHPFENVQIMKEQKRTMHTLSTI